jgi:hypothetical protein
VLFSCGQNSRSRSHTITRGKEAFKYTESIKSQEKVTKPEDKYIDTRYEYSDAFGKNLIIEAMFYGV